jgi:hypothetical protein
MNIGKKESINFIWKFFIMHKKNLRSILSLTQKKKEKKRNKKIYICYAILIYLNIIIITDTEVLSN